MNGANLSVLNVANAVIAVVHPTTASIVAAVATARISAPIAANIAATA